MSPVGFSRRLLQGNSEFSARIRFTLGPSGMKVRGCGSVRSGAAHPCLMLKKSGVGSGHLRVQIAHFKSESSVARFGPP